MAGNCLDLGNWAVCRGCLFDIGYDIGGVRRKSGV